MDAVARQVKFLTENTDEATRKRIIDQLRQLSYDLESPDDVLQRIIYTGLEISTARIGCDLAIFNILARHNAPMTLTDLQKATGAAPVLLGRILRYLSSKSMISEPDTDTFAATNITRALAEPGNQAGIHHYFDLCGRLYQEFPDFLAKHKYQDITENTNTVFQAAYKTSSPVFIHMAEHPQTTRYFNQYMAHKRKGMPTWLDMLPLESLSRPFDPARILFVDMGGKVGHECAALKARYPHLPGRVVLQDTPHAIGMALETPGVENAVHDIFTPQLVKNAKIYYMRAVLHDFPDAKVREILRNIIPAMAEDSVILIDEMVLPDKNVHWKVTGIDLTMMVAVASTERTQSQWVALLGSVGLKIVKIYTYTPSTCESVMILKRE